MQPTREARIGTVERRTTETAVTVRLALDGSGRSEIASRSPRRTPLLRHSTYAYGTPISTDAAVITSVRRTVRHSSPRYSGSKKCA